MVSIFGPLSSLFCAPMAMIPLPREALKTKEGKMGRWEFWSRQGMGMWVDLTAVQTSICHLVIL